MESSACFVSTSLLRGLRVYDEKQGDQHMTILAAIAGIILIVVPLLDGFETVIQPRRVTHRFRFARLYYRSTWSAWRFVALRLGNAKVRESFLSVFGPLSMIGLLASWLLGLMVGFALIHWSLGTPLYTHDPAPSHGGTFGVALYMSGTTLFTLGFGDITPVNPLGRALAVAESGLGFGFLAIIISYLPVLYQAYSQRETTISLLDARAGSPPSAGQLLLRLARGNGGKLDAVEPFLIEWESWAAQLLEIHLSFTVLTYYRSQHDNQSWLAALTMILDTCAILIAELDRAGDDKLSYRAQLTFAIARHAAVDLSLVVKAPPKDAGDDRFPVERRVVLRDQLRAAGVSVRDRDAKLEELRHLYEPFVRALAMRFLFTLPKVLPDDQNLADNWQRSAWMNRSPGIGSLPVARVDEEHFE